ncbi:four-carbon acid sugar kinase family protein [Cohnella sp. F6_2S_P_1]|uniref:Four-carbon acid sugar kinase family protein n=2 Tax=Cohnella hashimotonis TaxID=2826895 RepID=A0ABT6TD52_9BACL|nr:four-carbon acid sugar kinase family protein [Cohnella hashimotonis]MDI4644699.1 four-carbon acid sugar kinase family protein [Cohnella hashimotonis]
MGRKQERLQEYGQERYQAAGLLLSFYGDDFTGSTDVMEALALNGVRTVLFLEPPAPEALAAEFPDVRAFGVAGVSRAMSPAEMQRELEPIFERLRAIPTPLVHYKICSTFDSSPEVGSIGRAIELASAVCPAQRCVPLLVGVPELRRYTVFGNHFAGVGAQTYRLDLHPTMSRHPVTPMDEADLRVHLSRQTDKTIGLMDILDLAGDGARVRSRLAERLAERPDILLYDVLDEERLKRAGELIWEAAGQGDNRVVFGSSGVEYALVAHWREVGLAAPDTGMLQPRGAVDRLLVVSGSCSPTTESQIRYAIAAGFAPVPIQAEKLVDPATADQERRRLTEQANALLREGRSPLLYTALGAEDLAIGATREKLAGTGHAASDTGKLIGEQLGRLTREVVADNRLQRFLVAGGDTSGFVMRELGIYALECLMPIAPGGPLCRGYAKDDRFNGVELALKGGQVGKADYFVRVLEGK